MKQRILSLVLLFSMALTLLPVQAFAIGQDDSPQAYAAEAANPFQDVEQGDWWYDAVQYVRVNGIFSGTSSTAFSPDGSMTRGMFVTVLGRMVGVDAGQYQGSAAFSDVPGDAYFAPYVAWASKHGITTGTGSGRFSPDAPINREQMAAFFVRYFEAFGVDYETGANITTTAEDIDSVSAYAQEAVKKLWRQGLLNGDGVNFKPAENATRAQAAMICYRADQVVKTWYKEPGVPSGAAEDSGKDEEAEKPAVADSGSKPQQSSSSGSGSSSPRRHSSGGSSSTGGSTGTGETGGNTSEPGGETGTSGGETGGNAEPETGDSYAVNFYDGSSLIETFRVKKDEPLGTLPSVSKASKAGAILEGYYTDTGFTTPFYAENPVTQNMNVYARYESMGEAETLTIDSFAKMDQDADVSFTIRRVDGSIPAEEAAVLAVKDGSAPVEIRTVSNGDNTYTVYAPEGFNEGCSYELNLAEGWSFVNPDKPDTDTIRTAAFSIAMAEVEDLSMSESIRYIQDTPDIDYQVNGETMEVLASNTDLTNGGSFQYSGADSLHEDDILCIHEDERPETPGRDPMAAALYVKVSDIRGDTVYFESLEAEDQLRLYEIPDNFPMQAAELPEGDTGTIHIDALDTVLYAQMMGSEEGTAAKALEKIAAGDFVSIYVSADAVDSEEDVYFGEITGYDEATGEITFRRCTAEDIEESANLYKTVDVENTDLITPEEQAEIEHIVQAQVDRSSFGRDAAYLLADMATRTDGFRQSRGVQDFLAVDENGDPLSAGQLAVFAEKMQLEKDGDKDEVEVKAKVILDKNKLHFGSKGVQLAVEVSAKFKVDGKDGGAIHFDLSATFIQEIAVDPKVKGELVYKKILKIIPIPTGVQVNAIVDVKSYTAMSLRADIYSVAAEDKPLWDKFKDFIKDPSDLGNLPGVPKQLTEGLKTVGDAIDKIEETKEKIEKGLEDAKKLQSDLDDLWTVVETFSEAGFNRESYEAACETFGKTNVAGELMDMLHLTQDEISTDYINGLSDLMDRYSELLERETDWVQLVDMNMFDQHTPAQFGVMIGVQGNFVVRADVNIALGTNLEYEVGKRYNFWFRVGLFKPTSGSSTMDLIDERFAFQFYVMGKLGIKTGVRLKIYAALGSVDAISVGLTTELGPYVKLYGFFIYDYSKQRPANTQTWVSKEQMAGALYLEFGLYLMVGMEAKALFLDFDKNFVDEEFPLLDAGSRRYYYAAAYEPLDENDEVVVYNDGSAQLMQGCAVSMQLPEDIYALRYLDLTTGAQGTEALNFDNYNFQVSNPNFRVDNVGGKPVISVVRIPQNVRLMQCDLTITYKHGKMAFSTYDMSTTAHLAWTNMTAAEYQQVYTASVVVPDGSGGKQAVWRQRVRKGTPFDLPTEEELRKLLSWSDAKYVEGSGYGSQQTEDVTLIQDTMYTYDLGYQTYTLTVTGIEGGSSSRKFTAQYGEPFDFSPLWKTGSNGPDTYTRFAGLTLDGVELDLTRPVSGSFAGLVRTSNGARAAAQYEDDSAAATFTFTGLEHDDIEVRLRRGETPDTAAVYDALPEDVTITGFYPEVGPLEGDMTYQVVCEAPVGSAAAITFESNEGSEVAAIERTQGSVLGTLPVPTRLGYAFAGWFTDDETFEEKVDANTVVTGEMTLYAKWEVNGVTVTFHTNGGLNLDKDEATRIVSYGQPYGELPVPELSGYGFTGWFTAPDDSGEAVTEETLMNRLDDHTLYAHWVLLKEIPAEVFAFGERENYTFDGQPHPADYIFMPVAGETYTEDSFTFHYTRVGDRLTAGENIDQGAEPTMGGRYNVTVTREADNTYAKFEQTYTGNGTGDDGGVLYIERGTRRLDLYASKVSAGASLTGVTVTCDLTFDHPVYKNAKGFVVITDEYGYQIREDLDLAEKSGSVTFDDLLPETKFTISLEIQDDPNCEDATFDEFRIYKNYTYSVEKLSVTTGTPITKTYEEWYLGFGNSEESLQKSWDDNMDWYNEEDTEFTLNNLYDLMGLAKLVNDGIDDFEGKTIKLSRDMDSYRLNWKWIPIGTVSHPFRGTFDGDGHSIGNICAVANKDNPCAGLFGVVEDATIENVTIHKSYIEPYSKKDIIGNLIYPSGGLVGLASGETTIRNCHSSAVVKGITSAVTRILGGRLSNQSTIEKDCTYTELRGKNVRY